MSAPEAPVMTDIERLIAAQEETHRLTAAHTDAINKLGENVQWIIDNVKGIFEMFSNPAAMSMMQGMMMPGGNGSDHE